MGGKSRKSGGVSQDLIAKLKRGPKKINNNCGTKKAPTGGGFGIFGKDKSGAGGVSEKG